MSFCINCKAPTDDDVWIDHIDLQRRRVVPGGIPVCPDCLDRAIGRGPVREVRDLIDPV